MWKLENTTERVHEITKVNHGISSSSFCSFSCAKDLQPVCGEDGKTYSNACQLKKEECHYQKTIRISSPGPCRYFLPNCPPGSSNATSCLCPPGSWRGCQPCFCSSPGSIDSECDQQTGKCKCREKFSGHKCTECAGEVQGCRETRAVGLISRTHGNSVTTEGALGQLCISHEHCTSNDAVCTGSVCQCKLGYKQQSPVSCTPPPPQLCSFSPCEEGGTCEEHDGTFTCHCGKGRAGKYCEQKVKEIADTDAGFTGQSYVALKQIPNSVTRTSIQLSFRTFSKEGLILMTKQREGSRGDFLSISLVGGHAEVRYDLGSGPSALVSSSAVTLGPWHTLVFRRYHQDGMLQIDKTDPVQGKASGRNKSLNIRGSTYIGGHPYMNRTGDIAGTYKGLQGCVRNLRIRRKNIGLAESVEPLVETTAGMVPCSNHPCSEGHCKNEGQCEAMQGRKKVVCFCSKGFRGKRCHRRKKITVKISSGKRKGKKNMMFNLSDGKSNKQKRNKRNKKRQKYRQ